MTGLWGREPPNAVKQLLREAIKILGDFGCSHRIVQRFAHHCQHIVKIIR